MKKNQESSSHPLRVMRYCPKCGSDLFAENDVRSKRCGRCGFTFYLNCATAVVGVIVRDGALLMTRRAEEPHRGMWDLPGGFVEFGETVEEALKREIREELSIDVRIERYLFSQPNVYAFSSLDVRTSDLFFLCTTGAGAELVPSDDVASAEFVPIGEIDVEKIGLSSIRKAVTFLQKHTEMLEK